jgi:hypothetical protein
MRCGGLKMILTRRNIIHLAGVAITPWTAIRLIAATDFWNTKDPDAWTPDEIARLLKKSPWAKEITGERTATQRNSSSTTDPSISPNPRRSRTNPMGLPGANTRMPKAPSSSKTTTTYKGTVLWESAKVIRDAAKTPLPAGFENQYVLSVTGIPLARNSSRTGLDAVRQLSFLTAKGHDPLEAAAVQQNTGNGAIYYIGFAREAMPITKDDKEVVFTTAMRNGNIHFMAKFSPKEMLYRGELAC